MESYINSINAQSGTLKIAVTNLPEFKALVDKAEKEAEQLKKTIVQLNAFYLDIKFEVK